MTLPAYSMSIEEHIDNGYALLTRNIMRFEYAGPAALDLARYALLRQLLEDGITRPYNVSIVGMSVGGRNGDIISILSSICTEGQKISTVRTDEGHRCYAIYGENAYILSGIGIAMFYDRVINEFSSFNREEVDLWNRCKYDATDYLINKQACIGLIRRADRHYGPKSNVVDNWSKKYDKIFIQGGR